MISFREFLREADGDKVQPKDLNELKEIVEKTIKENGPKCDLNFIDTSKITIMSHLFEDSKFRAVLFDYYKQQNGISVIIGTFCKEFAGYTTKRSESDKAMQRKIMNIIGIKFRERQICVSKKECIKLTKLVYNEEEEVI